MGTTVGTFLIWRLADKALWARLWASGYDRSTFLIWGLGEIGNNSDFGGPNAVFRGFRFGENAQKRAHFAIFENRSFCRGNRGENEQFAKWAIRGVCGVAKQKVGMSLARKYAQFLHGVYTEMHACLLHGQPLRMRAHSYEP